MGITSLIFLYLRGHSLRMDAQARFFNMKYYYVIYLATKRNRSKLLF